MSSNVVVLVLVLRCVGCFSYFLVAFLVSGYLTFVCSFGSRVFSDFLCYRVR